MSAAGREELYEIAADFMAGDVAEVIPYGEGLVNDTYRAIPRAGGAAALILQRINARVFPNPQVIMENLRRVVDHASRHGARLPPERRLRLPRIYETGAGQDYRIDSAGGFWRALEFIAPSRTLSKISELPEAEALGYALGRFHHLLSDLAPQRLHATLPGFHIAPRYLARFFEVQGQGFSQAPEIQEACAFIRARSHRIEVLEAGKQAGRLPPRVIHGDPKLSNFLFHPQRPEAICLIDLDTVQAGLIHYDIGDCLRSSCRIGTDSARFDLTLCRAILRRYLAETRHFLSGDELDLLAEAIWLIPMELGIRFLTDYLAGNRYFKVSAPAQNLDRALVQFRLTLSIERQASAIRRLIDELGRDC